MNHRTRPSRRREHHAGRATHRYHQLLGSPDGAVPGRKQRLPIVMHLGGRADNDAPALVRPLLDRIHKCPHGMPPPAAQSRVNGGRQRRLVQRGGSALISSEEALSGNGPDEPLDRSLKEACGSRSRNCPHALDHRKLKPLEESARKDTEPSVGQPFGLAHWH